MSTQKHRKCIQKSCNALKTVDKSVLKEHDKHLVIHFSDNNGHGHYNLFFTTPDSGQYEGNGRSGEFHVTSSSARPKAPSLPETNIINNWRARKAAILQAETVEGRCLLVERQAFNAAMRGGLPKTATREDPLKRFGAWLGAWS